MMRTMPLRHSCATSSSEPTVRQPAARYRHAPLQCNANLLATSMPGGAPCCSAMPVLLSRRAFYPSCAPSPAPLPSGAGGGVLMDGWLWKRPTSASTPHFRWGQLACRSEG